LKKNLALTGMMGVGKTTIGKALSKELSMQFSDIDTIIEKKLKMTIKEVFKKQGEYFFRDLEEKITLQEMNKQGVVISLGGGAFMNTKIRNITLQNSKSFWLDLDINLLEQRLINSKKRPLLNVKNIKSSLKNIYVQRKDTYALANYKIDCNKLNDDLIIKKIIQIYVKN
tara:strand:- start:451 stop:960 length:510 start_codon:yes stop_codon:yes gene_type:complete